ncbi:hypothetical protein FIBSPDRAFT_175866 [Athelia psychrophila]|uniref:Uncharacterized protein n=1 Tax=Athelia psychrophila TaxID=1759441 RepID=A0A166ALI8_9AGAM|nr:hypothetical protein FIBSPDRAFT_175866 [Fibularhizoctonia sp. CBS 109695]
MDKHCVYTVKACSAHTYRPLRAYVEGPVQGYAFVAFLVRSPATRVSSSCSKTNDPTGGLVPPVTSCRSHRTVFRPYLRIWKRRWFVSTECITRWKLNETRRCG